jgi:CHAT domain-containing protein/Tfp pilus assembly protein PilF
MRLRAAQAVLVTACAVLLSCAAGPATAQPYARFVVPDSALAGAVRAAGAEYESAWNALLVTELRAALARADSAQGLAVLERRIARAEPRALGTSIAGDALALRRRWDARQRARRVAAAGDEAAALAAQRGARYGESDSLYRAALAAYRALGERRREAWVLGSAGSTWFMAGEYPRADSLYRLALVARRAIGDSSLVARALNTLGSIAYLTGRDAEAREYLLRTRALRESIGDRAGLTATLNYLGLVGMRLGEPDSARVWFEQGLTLACARGDSTRVAEILDNYSRQLADAGELERAQASYERALAIAEADGNAWSAARLQFGRGDLLRRQGLFTEAARAFTACAALSEEAQDTRERTTALTSLGRVWHNLQDPARALPPLEQAVTLADSLGDALAEALALNDLAIALRQAGDVGEATRRAQRACERAAAAGDSGTVHDAETTLGQLAEDRGDFAAARSWFERAAGAGRDLAPESRASDLINLGNCAGREGRLDDAERRYDAALDLARRAGLQETGWQAMLGLGDVAERRGAFPEALRWDRSAAALIDTLRARQQEERGSIALFSGRLFAYEALIHLLGKLDARFPDSAYAEEAFLWSERARARAFLDLVHASGGSALATEPLSLGPARALLRSDREALLEYSLGDSSSSLWVITRRAWRRIPLPPRPALRARAEMLRRGLAGPLTADERLARGAARGLYRTLVEPAEPLLRGVTHLLIAPDGPLALVPFEALLARDVPEEGTPPRGAYLIERFEVSYTPSATALATRVAGRSGGGIVALGDARFAADSAAGDGVDTPALVPLPNTAAEVAVLRSLAGARSFTALTGPAATRTGLLAVPGIADAQVVHIATHGEANEAEPGRSGLWLAREDDEPGFLSVEDILHHRLGADLVTLSACETGLGRLERGEGVLGLARAFLAAGSRSVVVSLWKVNDRSTALLMERFYRPLLTRGMPRERALAQAKRALLADAQTRSPFHWAPFVLIGANGPLP